MIVLVLTSKTPLCYSSLLFWVMGVKTHQCNTEDKHPNRIMISEQKQWNKEKRLNLTY